MHQGLWAWFPITGPGIRALVIFFCGLIIIILRIAQFHIGIRTSNSPFQTFLISAAKLKTIETIASYCLAGWLYGQVFRWSAPASSSLSWVTRYPGDRTRLNERAVFLVIYVVLVGAVNALLHLFQDDDRLVLGTARSGGQAAPSPATAGKISKLNKVLALRLPYLIMSAILRSVVALFASIVVYMFFLRPFAWSTTLSFFRIFYNLPQSNLPPLSWPFFSKFSFIPRCLQAGAMFSLLLVVSNAAFSLFLVSEPIKDGKPLTSGSKDPNGSLLNGLKSKKDKVRAFAMWELAFIARDFPDSRIAIYMDIDCKEGQTWSQICKICLDVVKALESRIDAAIAAPPASNGASGGAEAAKEPEIKRLTKPIKDDVILVTPTKKTTFTNEMEKMVSKVVFDPHNPSTLSPHTQQMLSDAKQRLLDVRRDISRPENSNSSLQAAIRRLLAIPVVGWPFRLTFRNRITAVVLGKPYGEPSIYINAVSTLSLMAVHSLEEDKFGNVQRDVANIIRELTRVTRKLEAFKASYPNHWTDVEAQRACPEVDDILGAFKESLTGLIESFGVYRRDLRLSEADMRLAEEAARPIEPPPQPQLVQQNQQPQQQQAHAQPQQQRRPQQLEQSQQPRRRQPVAAQLDQPEMQQIR